MLFFLNHPTLLLPNPFTVIEIITILVKTEVLETELINKIILQIHHILLTVREIIVKVVYLLIIIVGSKHILNSRTSLVVLVPNNYIAVGFYDFISVCVLFRLHGKAVYTSCE